MKAKSLIVITLLAVLALLLSTAATAQGPQPPAPSYPPQGAGLPEGAQPWEPEFGKPFLSADSRAHVWATYQPYQLPDVDFVSEMTSFMATSLAAQGGYLYIASDGLRIVDARAPQAPREVSYLEFGGFWPKEVAISGDYVYPILYWRLPVISVANPAQPVEVGSAGLAQGCAPKYGVATAGSFAYAVDWCRNLYIIDISNPNAPSLRKVYNTSGHNYYGPYGVTVQGNYAYVANGDQGLEIVDISNPVNPVKRGEIDTPGMAWKVAVVGNHAYVADQGGGLRIIDVSNPGSPVEISAVTTVSPRGVAVANDDYVYVANGDVRIFDVSNPASPVQAGSFNTTGAEAVAVEGPYIYVARGNGGVLILWFSPPARGSIPPDGGTLESPGDGTLYTFPAGTFSGSVIVTHVARFPAHAPSPGELIGIGHVFDVSAVYESSGLPAEPLPGRTYTLTVRYTDAEKGPAIENTLALYYWDGSQWVKEPSSTVDTIANTVTAHPDHFSRWAVLGETKRVYLPLVLKGH